MMTVARYDATAAAVCAPPPGLVPGTAIIVVPNVASSPIAATTLPARFGFLTVSPHCRPGDGSRRREVDDHDGAGNGSLIPVTR
jgi:hypothetical protein